MPEINIASAISNSAVLQEPGVTSLAAASHNDGFSNTINSKLKTSSSLDHIFEDASRQYQVPVSLLKAVAKAESDFNPKAVSKAGAQGIMQLMPATARELGVSDSFDPRQNIMGGAKYLSQMLKKYDGNAKLALAAYNAGSNNVDKYGGVPPFKETQNYVVKVMKYAGSDISATVPAYAANNRSVSGNYGSGSYTRGSNNTSAALSGSYEDVLQTILSFDDFTSEDYLLFLEILKCSLQTPQIGNSYDESGSFSPSALYGNRIQTLY